MGFSISDSKLSFSGILEEEIIRLCVENAGLCVLIAHQRRALSAAVQFFVELSDETKQKYKMSSNRYEMPFENGSIIRFVGFADGTNSIARVPTIPINIMITYGLRNSTILRALFVRMGKYDKARANTVINKMTPLFIEDNYMFGGKEFYDEYENLLKRCKADAIADERYSGEEIIDGDLEDVEDDNELSELAEVYKENKEFEKKIEMSSGTGKNNTVGK